MSDNGFKLKVDRLRLHIRRKLLTVRVVKHLRLRVLSSLTSDISMDGVSSTSLSNLIH